MADHNATYAYNEKAREFMTGATSIEVSKEDEDVEAAITKKLLEMSIEERSHGLYEVHGVADLVAETPDLIDRSLVALETEIKAIQERAAYEVACQQSREYVAGYRLRFLRTDQFDAKKAASQMVKFFELKRSFFGDAKLSREIVLQDLPLQCQEKFRLGLAHFLSQRDMAGRAVLFNYGDDGLREFDPPLTNGTGLSYLYFLAIQCAARDEEVQKRGTVLVNYALEQTKYEPEAFSNHLSTISSMPMRIAAAHMCTNNAKMDERNRTIRLVLEQHELCRFRCHSGPHAEVQYELMTFGIPRNILPVDRKGKLVVTTKHRQTLKMFESYGGDHFIQIPGKMDITLGRGFHGQSSAGKERYDHLLQEYRQEYDGTKRSEKPKVAHRVLTKLHECGCRFLKFEESAQGGAGWVEIDEEAAKLKIAHAFRNLRPEVKSSNVTRNQQQKLKKTPQQMFPSRLFDVGCEAPDEDERSKKQRTSSSGLNAEGQDHGDGDGTSCTTTAPFLIDSVLNLESFFGDGDGGGGGGNCDDVDLLFDDLENLADGSF